MNETRKASCFYCKDRVDLVHTVCVMLYGEPVPARSNPLFEALKFDRQSALLTR